MGYILKICGWYPSEVDALSGDFVQRHARAIATQMPVVSIFAVKDPRAQRQKLRIVKTEYANHIEYIVYYPQYRILDTVMSQFWYLNVIRKVMPEIVVRFGTPMVIHVNIAWKAVLWVKYLTRKWQAPVVVTENSTEYQPNALLNIRKMSQLRQKLTASLFCNALGWIPVSQQLGLTLGQLYGPKPFVVVPNCVDTELFYARPKEPASFQLLHISTLTHQKNPDGLFRVFDRLLQNHPNISITVVGPSPSTWSTWNQRYPYRDRLVYKHYMPNAAIANEMAKADLLVLFSRYENLPCVILEAFCTGVPVVATEVGGISEIIDAENGMIVPSEDEDAFFDAISMVITGKKKFDSAQISEAARRKYSLPAVGAQFLDAYKKLGITWD